MALRSDLHSRDRVTKPWLIVHSGWGTEEAFIFGVSGSECLKSGNLLTLRQGGQFWSGDVQRGRV